MVEVYSSLCPAFGARTRLCPRFGARTRMQCVFDPFALKVAPRYGKPLFKLQEVYYIPSFVFKCKKKYVVHYILQAYIYVPACLHATSSLNMSQVDYNKNF